MALVDRRERVRAALQQATTEMLRFSEQIDAPPAEVMVAACQLGLEGLIGKRLWTHTHNRIEVAVRAG